MPAQDDLAFGLDAPLHKAMQTTRAMSKQRRGLLGDWRSAIEAGRSLGASEQTTVPVLGIPRW